MKFLLLSCLHVHAAGLKIKTQDFRLAQSQNEADETSALLTKFVESHGGSATILLIGDSTMHQFVELMEGLRIQGLGVTFVENKGCLHDRPFKLNPPPTAIVANIGLHVMHMFPALSCKNGARFSKEWNKEWEQDMDFLNHFGPSKLKGNKDCGTYESIVKEFAEYMTTNSPNSMTFWKTTNSVCTDGFQGPFKESLEKWNNPETRPAVEQECRNACPSRYQSPERQCGDEIYSRHASLLQHDTAFKVLRDYPSIKVLDAFKVTDNHCEATEPQDGRHYFSLDPAVLLEFARLL